MRATVFREYGGPEVLRWEEVPDPVASRGDVVIDVHACGVNHCDLDSRAGTSRWEFAFPMVLGGEFAGVISEIGDGVTGLSPGDPVTAVQYYPSGNGGFVQFGIDRWGGYAERVVVPAHAVIPLRSDDEIPLAAAAQTVATTAWRMVSTLADLQPGETVLVPSASGGVGSVLVGAAKLLGARVIATVGAADKNDAVSDLGADVVGCYATNSVVELVMEATGGRGVDCVLDTVGGPQFSEHLAALRLDGRLVTCGAHAGEVVPLDIVRLFQHGHRIIGFGFATDTELREGLGHVLEGRLRVPMACRFELADASAAHAVMDRREHVGKLLLERPGIG
jgi:NADPH:quinone reductase-like Zn-dependent oxidoreductase